LVTGSNQIGVAQPEQPQINLTSADKQHLLEGISFQLGNVTFSHHTAAVNGIQGNNICNGIDILLFSCVTVVTLAGTLTGTNM
jgi:hypothetical protein